MKLMAEVIQYTNSMLRTRTTAHIKRQKEF